jgi:hypothetical protein
VHRIFRAGSKAQPANLGGRATQGRERAAHLGRGVAACGPAVDVAALGQHRVLLLKPKQGGLRHHLVVDDGLQLQQGGGGGGL